MSTCRHPDRDQPKMLCGYPIPCPWHTAIIHAEKTPITVEIPIHSDVLKCPESLGRLGDLARAFAPLSKTKKRKANR